MPRPHVFKMELSSHKRFICLRRLLHRIKISHLDDGTDDFSHHPHRKRRLAEEAERQAMRRPRTVSAEDRIMERGVNPRTGMVSPLTPAVTGGEDYIGDLVPTAKKRNFAGTSNTRKRCNSDGRWRQNSSSWDMVPPTPGASLTSLIEEDVQTADDGPARPISIQDLQDRFLVQMPGVDDPAPRNPTDAQIRKYQRAVSMVAKAGGSDAGVLVPESMSPKPRTNAEYGRRHAALRPHTIPRKSVGSGPTNTTSFRANTSRSTAKVAEGHILGTISAGYYPLCASQVASPTTGSVKKEGRPTIQRQTCASSVPQLQLQSRNQKRQALDPSATCRRSAAKYHPIRASQEQHQGRANPTRTTSAESAPSVNDDTHRHRDSNRTADQPAVSTEIYPVTSIPRPSPAQATFVNRAKVKLQPVVDDCMPPNIPFAPETWFKGHWANDDPEHSIALSSNPNGVYQGVVPIVCRRREPNMLERVSPPWTSISSTISPFSPASAITHVISTLMRAPAALRSLRAEDTCDVQPEVYFQALREVLLAGAYLLIAFRMMTLMADTIHVLGALLRWGWIPALVGFGVAKWCDLW